MSFDEFTDSREVFHEGTEKKLYPRLNRKRRVENVVEVTVPASNKAKLADE